MIKFHCSSCSQKLGVPDNYAGKRIRCNKCGQPSFVPKPEVALTPVEIENQPAVQAADSATARFFAETPAGNAKPAPIQIELQPPSPGLAFDDLPPEDPHLEAIRQASRQRAAVSTASAPASSAPSAPRSRGAGKDKGFSIQNYIPEILRLPITLLFGLAGMAIVISLWVTASIMTQQPLNFVTLFVPMACAGAMAVTAVNRGILFGILAVLLGMAGICAGRAAVVKFAVIPALKVNSQKEILQDLKTMLNDPKQQLPPDLSAKSIVKDGDFMFCVALVAAVDKDDADPAIARKLAIDRLKTSGKSNIFDSLVKATYGPARVNEPNYTDSEAEIIEKAQSHSMEWFENDQQLESARLYYPALNQLCIQTEWIKILENPSKTFMFGFFATLGLLDVLWTLVGLGLGYTTAVFDN